MKTIFNQLYNSAKLRKTPALNAWITELSDMNDLSALKFSTQQLAKIISDENNKPQQLLDLIIEVEEVNVARLENLNLQFVSIQNIKPELEIDLSEACYNYCRQSYIFHLKVVEKVIDPRVFKLKNNMSLLILARTFYMATNMLKWRMYVQANPPGKMWLQIYTLYRVASQQALLSLPIALFNSKNQPDSATQTNPKVQTTLSAYFVQICMLGQLIQANMPKMQIDITAKLLNTLLTHAKLSSQYQADVHLFFVDCSKDAPANRLRNVEVKDGCRYWELDDLEKQIAIGINTSDRGEIPQSLLTSKIANPKHLNETLTVLYAQWTKLNYTRQRRREPRHATSKTAKVNAGIVNICNQVHQINQLNSGFRLSNDGKSFDERLIAHTTLSSTNLFGNNLLINSATLDVWIITDESTHGLGTRVSKYANILARPNKLVALIMDENPNQIIIGIIRCVKPTHANQLKVGIEIISHHPTWVQLKPINVNDSFANTVAETEAFNHSTNIDIGVFSGIYVPIEAGLTESSFLLLPKINYQINKTYAISIAGIPKRLKLGEIIESQDDWVKVLFPF